jgi:hypothetical protein
MSKKGSTQGLVADLLVDRADGKRHSPSVV